MARSKWIDPKRIAHGVSWRYQRWRGERRLRPSIDLSANGSSFRESVLAHYGVTDVDELDATRRMWADFTLGSVDRGALAVQRMGGPRAFAGKSVLDVGCAQGGFVVAASRAGASRVVGIDVNPKVFETAPLLLADYGISAEMLEADLTERSLSHRLGRFDLILCNDVLEHVTDVEAAIANLDRLLTPEGRIFLEIPNGRAVQYVRSDGHYKLPGITLLDFDQARRWHEEFFPGVTTYDTYFYGTLDYYLAAFSRVRIALRLDWAPPADRQALATLNSELDELRQEMSDFSRRHSGRPVDLVGEIERRVHIYIGELQASLDRWENLERPAEAEVVGTAIRCGYEIGNWVLIGARV